MNLRVIFHTQLVEAIFAEIDKEQDGKVPYKRVMNVKAVVARLAARKPSARHNAWREKLADKRLDFIWTYQVQCVLPETRGDAPV